VVSPSSIIDPCRIALEGQRRVTGGCAVKNWWTFEEQETLRPMLADGVTVWEIAQRLGRTYGAVKERMCFMGLVAKKSRRAGVVRKGRAMRK
jgi:hypothetical protein